MARNGFLVVVALTAEPGCRIAGDQFIASGGSGCDHVDAAIDGSGAVLLGLVAGNFRYDRRPRDHRSGDAVMVGFARG